MGRDERENEQARLVVLDSVRGHDSSVAHVWNHTGGLCPKCNCPKQEMFFCAPDQTKLPRLRGCEMSGEHVHRMCASCHYPWIERPLDQAMLAEQKGEVQAESELAAALAWLLHQGGPVRLGRPVITSYRGWVIQFERDGASDMMVLSVRPPEPQTGEAVHPQPGDASGSQEG